MCTIILLHQVVEAFPLVVAANRDEAKNRPWSGPEWHPPAAVGAPWILSGIDHEKGGTWMGANDRGLLVGLTNQPPPSPGAVDRGRRSRGEVVREALSQSRISDVRAYLESLDGRDYNGFNLVYGDGARLEVAYARPEAEQLRFADVPPGLHVLPNGTLDLPMPKVARVRDRLKHMAPEDGWPAWREALIDTLADRRRPPPSELEAESPWPLEIRRALQALVVDLPEYGTSSATLAALSPGGLAHYAFAASPPDRGPFEPLPVTPPAVEAATHG